MPGYKGVGADESVRYVQKEKAWSYFSWRKASPHFLESEADAAWAVSSENTSCCFFECVLILPPSCIYLHFVIDI